MPKEINHAEFKFSYTYQYYSPQGKAGRKYGPYKGSVSKVYLEGDEDEVWSEVLDNFGSTKTKRYALTDKKIVNKINVGKQVR